MCLIALFSLSLLLQLLSCVVIAVPEYSKDKKLRDKREEVVVSLAFHPYSHSCSRYGKLYPYS